MDVRISPVSGPLSGDVRVPGDKSVSHRAVLFAAIAEGDSRLEGVLDSADVRATIAAVTALGARVMVVAADAQGLTLHVTGWGAEGPCQPGGAIECANSGTTARLLMGAVAGWPIDVTFSGDDSLSKRPMRRIADPLCAMGATVASAEGGTLPVRVAGGALGAIAYESPVASAQVKSAVLLAGLRALGRTSVSEPSASRDHTERLLPLFGVPVETGSVGARPVCAVVGPAVPHAADVEVPGDPSSAAFMVAAAVIVPGSSVRVPDVLLNPTRTGFARVLERMGADVTAYDVEQLGAEESGTLVATHR